MAKVNRFNKKNFNDLMLELANNTEFKFEVAKYSKGSLKLEEIMPTKEFRNWCKKLLIQCGMDKKEASKVLKEEFTFETMNGLYNFFVAAVYTYMSKGNKFDMIPTKEFKGSLYLSNVPKTKKVAKYYSPKDRSFIGEFETSTGSHVKLKASSECPKYLQSRKKV